MDSTQSSLRAVYGKAQPVPIEKIAGWTHHPFWTLRRRIKSIARTGNRTCTYWIAQTSIETRDKKLIEIYWHNAYIYWLFQMLKMSFFYTDRRIPTRTAAHAVRQCHSKRLRWKAQTSSIKWLLLHPVCILYTVLWSTVLYVPSTLHKDSALLPQSEFTCFVWRQTKQWSFPHTVLPHWSPQWKCSMFQKVTQGQTRWVWWVFHYWNLLATKTLR